MGDKASPGPYIWGASPSAQIVTKSFPYGGSYIPFFRDYYKAFE